jgi:cytochrome c2
MNPADGELGGRRRVSTRIPEERRFPRKAAVAGVLAGLALFIILARWVPAGAEGTRWAQEGWIPSEPLQGRIVFEQKRCTTCHSIGGAGGDIGPDLAEQTFSGTFLDLASALWNHIPDMVVHQKALDLEWPSFTDEEVASLISYLYYLRYLGVPGDEDRGERVYEDTGCPVCHRVGERGGGTVGPALDRLKQYASPIYMIQAIWNHGPQMQRQIREVGIERPRLNGRDIADLSAYIRSISEWNVDERIYLSPGNPNDGESVFREKGCIACHASHGEGGDIGPSLDQVDLSGGVTDIAAMMWNHAEEMQMAMGEEHISWPTFEGKEMADLIAYLYFVNFIDPPGDPEKGERLFEEKKCIVCHSIDGVGGTAGPDLARKEGLDSSAAILGRMFNHAQKMSETVLSKGETWPVLSGPQMRDIFSYLRAVGSTEP